MNEDRIVELETELQEQRQRTQRAERALAKLQTSLPVTVGQLVIDAGTDPRRLLRLPFTLLRIRRERRRTRALRAGSDVEVREWRRDRARLPEGAERLLLPRRTVTVDDRRSVLLIAPDATADRLRPIAHVSRALPHDAAALMETLDADIALVDARVATEGSPWFPLGQPGEGRREESLLALRRVCMEFGRPLVLVFDPSASPGLSDFAELCDVVLHPAEWEACLDVQTVLEEWCSPSARSDPGETDPGDPDA